MHLDAFGCLSVHFAQFSLCISVHFAIKINVPRWFGLLDGSVSELIYNLIVRPSL